MDVRTFLTTVVTAQRGFFCLALRDEAWIEKWYRWPEDIDEICTVAQEVASEFDVYFSSYLFSEQSSKKEFVLPSRTIQADLDTADISTLPITPCVIVESSPGRHQAYWVLREDLELDKHETLSRNLTYAIDLCDRSGWALGRKLRIPDTLNHKYHPPCAVKVIEDNGRITTQDELDLLPERIGADKANIDTEWLEGEKKVPETGPQELLLSYKANLATKVYSGFNTAAIDRSAYLWSLECALFRAGASRDDVYFLAKSSVNNKFASLHRGGERELSKDILRAEAEATTNLSDARSAIDQVRKGQGTISDKKAAILKIVYANMVKKGKFAKTTDDSIWYIRRDLGRPIQIGSRSEYFNMIMDIDYGLNRAEAEQAYVVNGLLAHCYAMPTHSILASMSYYDQDAQSVLLHTGKKDIIKIAPSKVDMAVNSMDGIVFPWIPTAESFGISSVGEEKWYDVLYGDCFDNCINLTKEQAMALMRVWTLFIFFRQGAVARPILALIGQPGCLSKNTLLSIRRGEHSARTYTLAQAYDRFYGRWDWSIPTKIMSLKEGVVQWRNIKRIISSGKKWTYKVSIEGRDPIYATLDHKFLTPIGYHRLEELLPGDEVIVEGSYIGSKGQFPATRRIVTAKYHPYARQKMVNGYGPYASILYCRAVLEAALNGMTTRDYLQVVNCNEDNTLTFLLPNVHIHHIDENPANDSLDNLEVMSKLEHDTYHGHTNQVNLGACSGIYGTSIAKIVSISKYREEDTYDIEMEDNSAPNFLVNNVVVHNSGKSTLFRRVYCLLFGREKSIGAISSMEDFDHATANDPVVVFDNVDTYERWLPDRLALSAASSSIVKRRLYTDMDTVVLKRQALLGLTAHSPSFGREDVADRMLIVNFERLKSFRSESEILEVILKQRSSLWTSIIKDIQKVLSTPVPTSVPQFRIEDFARWGARISTAVGCYEDFCTAIKELTSAQKTFALEEEGILITSIQRIAKRPNAREWKHPAQLWTEMELMAPDRISFVKRYKNATFLAKKLWAMMDVLKNVVNLEWKLEKSRVWRITDLDAMPAPIGLQAVDSHLVSVDLQVN